MRTVAIVGVGLIGGSFGLAIKDAGFNGRVLGVSSDGAIRDALQRGAIDAGATLEQAAGEADLIYLAQPIGRIVHTIRALDPLVRSSALVTDAGSTKAAIVAAARDSLKRCQFLGGHPMAGKEKRGVAVAEPGLFAGRTYVLTPEDPGDLETPAALDFLDWLERIGARSVVLGATEHDRIVSFTSHLPQLASTALAATVSERLATPGELQVAGTGLTDTTRLALSSYDLWRDILVTNREAIEAALTAYIQKLEHLRGNLGTREMQQEFEAAAELASRIRRG